MTITLASSKSLILILALFIPWSFAALCSGQITDWQGGAGFSWSNAANWTAGLPTNLHTARLGNLGAESTTYLDANSIINRLEISNGAAFYTDGFDLVTTGDTLLHDPFLDSIVPFIKVEGSTFATNDLDIVSGWLWLSNGGNVFVHGELVVTNTPNASVDGELVGNGTVSLTKNSGVALRNDGEITPGKTGLTIAQLANGLIDLDGYSGDGLINMFRGTGDRNLTIAGTELSDPFSGRILLAGASVLDMGLDVGWIADQNSEITFIGTDHLDPGIIQGAPLTLQGEMHAANIHGHPSLARIYADAEIAESAVINVDEESLLAFHGQSLVDGAEFNLAEGGKVNFNGTTILESGTINTFSGQVGDGAVEFLGPTEYSGNLTVNGIARQVGDASVSDSTTINAQTFDLDGNASANWEIANALTINTDKIESVGGNYFNGTVHITGSALAKLTLNINQGPEHWEMQGEMTLANSLHFPVTRVDGVQMELAGDLHVDGENVRIAADTNFMNSSTTSFASADSSLVMQSASRVLEDANFLGAGTLVNHTTGQMTIADGASLNEAGLENRGLLKIDDSAGIADVARFENSANGRLMVDVGGHVAGDQFDVLLTGSGVAQLDGRLIVKLIDAGNGPFQPAIGDEFTIIAAVAGVNGQFSQVPMSILDGTGYEWEVLYNSNDVTIRVSNTIPNTYLGDINQDGLVNLLDVTPFVSVVESGEYNVFADVNCDGLVNLLDVNAFVALMTE